MRAEYDFSKLNGKRNPYAAKLKKPVTMRISSDVIAYFKHLADEMGVPYQILINMYLRDCVQSHRKIGWVR
jgi:predicted DNA binding CopG/RHH family protein